MKGLEKYLANHRLVLCIGAFLAIGLTGSAYGFYNTHKNLETTEEARSSLENRLGELEGKLASAENDNKLLSEALANEQSKNEEFAEQIEEIADTVGILDKLAKTDKELLQKYSKVYFLNEHYHPEDLTKLDSKYLATPSDEEYLHTKVLPFMRKLFTSAEKDKVDLSIVSAFRSFDTQKDLKGGYSVTYGSGANTFSADQGYSEHQLGTTVDFSSSEINGSLNGFQNTAAYTWLTKNAYKYGFTLSYPPGNAYYIFEPWHWRFVGENLAKDLHDDKKYFYDLDQREIDEYLVEIFD